MARALPPLLQLVEDGLLRGLAPVVGREHLLLQGACRVPAASSIKSGFSYNSAGLGERDSKKLPGVWIGDVMPFSYLPIPSFRYRDEWSLKAWLYIVLNRLELSSDSS